MDLKFIVESNLYNLSEHLKHGQKFKEKKKENGAVKQAKGTSWITKESPH